jgi:hypothetical protein
MIAIDERTVALSMLRLWGGDAAKVAYSYAQEHDNGGAAKLALHWYNVTRVILQFRPANTNVPSRAHG